MTTTIDGSAGVTTNSGAIYNGIASGTAVASTSGTSIDFTGIPSWVKRITVMLSGVSTSGTSIVLIQIGAGSVTTSGYASSGSIVAAAVLPFAVWFTNESLLLRIVTIVLCALAIFRHRKNMQRLVAGTENRLGKKTSTSEDAK